MKTAKTKFPTLLMLFSVWMFLMACNDDDDPVPMEEDDIVDVVMASSNFTVLESAVVEADLVTTLKGDGPFTVFAPTDAAFTAFLDDTNMTAEDLLGSPSLADVLTYHVLAGEVMATDVSAGEVSTVNGASFYVSEDVEGKFWINGSAMVTDTDITASNGVIHALDYVIMPPSQSIAEIAVGMTTAATPEFTHLVGALQRANLVDAVSGDEGDLTVFAPTDAAFQALYDTNPDWNDFNDIPMETLTAVLTAHVVPARAFSQDLRTGTSLTPLNTDASLEVDLGAGTVGGAALNTSMLNIHATNGVIHVINDVILP
ncbi:fasciclin domain-containing protein [Echinicola vietnamensis]|uniref:Secreted/surface protein with fasciclin-like repeats n=1 Tax=Echinicola vietnamensis (strain DSM 17526 / LMG 23754 / KMM 6221) TaxID=926556 RepID=L0FUU2_ECHVK|nr:fasciclin domain-containing protein [Echinicola vietnamensis]AGA76506.1 secreted/surface protein with fasciclin-like repeats [Echinicola vietnamensis DSM 17526]